MSKEKVPTYLGCRIRDDVEPTGLERKLARRLVLAYNRRVRDGLGLETPEELESYPNWGQFLEHTYIPYPLLEAREAEEW